MRPDHVGDVLLSSAAVQFLTAAFPKAHVTYLVGPWSAEAARCGPRVDEVRTLRYPGFTRAPKRSAVEPYGTLARWAQRLRQGRYDLAVILRPDHWWGALLALAAGIPLRVGGRTTETEPLLTHAYAAKPDEHWAEQALGIARLAAHAGGASQPPAAAARVIFNVSDAARAESEAMLREAVGQRIMAIHPGAGAALKSWPIERWAAVVNGLDAQTVVLSGAPGDEAVLQCIAQRTSKQATIACGQSLAVSAALFERCAVVIAPDSGAAHLAGAVGTPTVRLYGPASAEVYGPWPARRDQVVLQTHLLNCVPCGHMIDPPCGVTSLPACMLALSPDHVIEAVNAVLGQIEN